MEEKISRWIENEFEKLPANRFFKQKNKEKSKNKIIKNSLKVYNKYLNQGYSEYDAYCMAVAFNNKFTFKENLFSITNTLASETKGKTTASIIITLLLIIVGAFIVENDELYFISLMAVFILADVFLFCILKSSNKIYKILLNSLAVFYTTALVIYSAITGDFDKIPAGIFLVVMEVFFIQLFIILDRKQGKN